MIYLLHIFNFYLFHHLLGCSLPFEKKIVKPPDYEIIKTFNHNTEYFTQGLIFHKGFLYESTGIKGKSIISKTKIDNNSLKEVKKIKLENKYFGEGITIFDDQIIQVTWKSKIGFVYNLDLKFQKEFEFKTSTKEGWGITNNDNELIVSDGSHYLHYWDPKMVETKKITISYQGNKIDNLNELEYYQDSNGKEYVLANIWLTNKIAVIDLQTGKVEKMLDFSYLSKLCKNINKDVLNGIAYDKKSDFFYITGKNWDTIFCVQIDI